jgi:hypothetical protein
VPEAARSADPEGQPPTSQQAIKIVCQPNQRSSKWPRAPLLRQNAASARNPALKGASKQMAESMSEKQLRDFAKTTWNFDESSEQEEWQIAAR